MKVLGVDPSTTLSGTATAINGTLTDIDVWKGNSKDSPDRRLYDWHVWFNKKLVSDRPDLVVYAAVAYVRNMDTIRKLARTEAPIIIQCKKFDIPVIEGRDTQGRSIVFDDGNFKKKDVLVELRKCYPDLNWLRASSGGEDQADAAVMALAGPTILERK